MSRVLVTGASKGIGRATVRELAARGHEVVATARSRAALEDLPTAARLALDVTDQESVDAALAAAGELDALISNAGETLRAPAESVPLTEVSRLFELNTVGALRVAQAVLPGMRARGRGRLLFVSSITGRIVVPLGGAYAASKWALEALAEAIAIEAGHFRRQGHLARTRSRLLRRQRTRGHAAQRRRPVPAAGPAARRGAGRVHHRRGSRASRGRQLGGPRSTAAANCRPAGTLLAARHATADVPFRIAPLRW